MGGAVRSVRTHHATMHRIWEVVPYPPPWWRGERRRTMSYSKRNGVRQSKEVRRAVRKFKKLHNRTRQPCAVCGRGWKWYSRFHVHHLFPVSRFPDRAADEETFRWVHAKCHLVVGHAGDWSNYQSRFDELAEMTHSGLNPSE